MIRRELLLFAINVWTLIVLGIVVMLLYNSGICISNICAYTVDDAQNVYIASPQKLIMVTTDGIKTEVRCHVDHIKAITVTDNEVLVWGRDKYAVINKADKSFSLFTTKDDGVPTQRLRSTVKLADGTTYKLNTFLQRYTIRQFQPNGTVLIRYRLPIGDYIVKLLLIDTIVYGIALCAGIPLSFALQGRINRNGTIALPGMRVCFKK